MYQNEWLPEMFSDFFNRDYMSKTKATAPAINVLESDDCYVVELAAAGMKREDFDVRLNEDGDLHVKMTPSESPLSARMHYLRREFAYGTFEQTLLLPDDVDRERIQARVADGVLTVTLPKLKAEAPKPSRSINVL